MSPTGQILYDPDRSVVVEASAGTGKTYCLARRYLRLVATRSPDGSFWANPSEIVTVTFTRAAAAVMKQRIVTLLSGLADGRLVNDLEKDTVLDLVSKDCGPADLERLLEQVPTAPVNTFHGLCADLLREFPELSGVSPEARVIEPDEDRLLSIAFVGRYLDRILDDQNHALAENASKLVAERSAAEVRSELAAIVGAYDPPDEIWLEPEGVKASRDKLIQETIRRVFDSLAGIARETLKAHEDRAALNATENQQARIKENIGKLQDFLGNEERVRQGSLSDPDRFFKTLYNLGKVKLTGLGNAKHDQQMRDSIKQLKQLLKNVKNNPLVYCLSRAENLGDTPSAREHLDRIASYAKLGLAIRNSYEEDLRNNARLRYDDLERKTLALLKTDAAREYLHNRFKHILVDEFQDTNRRQDEIINALAKACAGDGSELKTFYVGDPKQAIYRFRGAELDLFIEKIDEARREGCLEPLPRTWRTSPELCAFFNRFFPGIFKVPDQEFPKPLQHTPDGCAIPWPGDVDPARTRSDLEGKPVDLLLRIAKEGGTEDDGEATSTEASRIAAYLAGLAEDVERPRVPYNRMAVLIPKWSLAEPIREALEAVGIPAQVGGGRGLLALPEVRDLVNLVRFWADWRDDLAAVGVLRGPLFALSDLGLYVLTRLPGVEKKNEEGSWIEWEDKATSVPLPWPRSLHAVMRHGHMNAEKAVDALVASGALEAGLRDDRLEQLRTDKLSLEAGQEIFDHLSRGAGFRSTADLLTDVISRFRLEAHWLASSRSDRAVANAWKFVEIVRALESDGPDLDRLCAWLDSATEPAPVGLLDADLPAVTITTVHGAKGGEWQVVVVAGLGAGYGGGAENSWRSGELDLPGGERAAIPRVKWALDGFSSMSDPLEKSCGTLENPLDLAETRRLLYVAMTRAKDRLCLSGEVKGNNKILQADASSGKGQEDTLRLCKNRLDFVLAGLRPTTRETGDVLDLPENSGLESFVNIVEDEYLAASPKGPTREGTTSRDIEVDDRAVAWEPSGSMEILNPSGARLPDALSTEEVEWETPDPKPDPVTIPQDEEGETPAEMGDLFHAVMEAWNFTGPRPGAEQCAAIAERLLPGTGEAHGNWLAECVRLIDESQLGKELKNAAARGALFHEVPVDVLTAESFRIRGSIDVLFQDESGRWCVLDYKLTRKVTTETELRQVQSKYAGQLMLYHRALSLWSDGKPGRIGLWLAPAGMAMWMKTLSG